MGVKGIKKPRPSQEGVCPNFFILILILKKRCKGSVFILNHQMICAKSAHMINYIAKGLAVSANPVCYNINSP